MANIKVSDSTRDQLADLANQYPGGRASMDKLIQHLISEHRHMQQERLAKLVENEEFMARIEAARREPLEDGYSTEDVLAMLAKRQREDAA